MYKIDDTSRILTVIGLIWEGLAIMFFAIGAIILRQMASIPKEDLLAEGMLEIEADLFLNITNVFSIIFIVIGVVLITVFLINVVIFTKLINQKYTVEQARYVYIYQAVWGGVSLLFNTVTGILYLISAVSAQMKQKLLIKVSEDK
ncbi:MAG: hypothetical protein ACNA7U_00645 [Candidatus Izemoplasmataceae bacterium]|uniref:hypothetical protein n=1 Tax=Liberiplasma polymorphum TaxID=3374570 RepID=UPI003775D356